MSAIIAGNACRRCEKPYYWSFGHPKWFEDVRKHGKKPGEQYLKWREMQRSGLCVFCYAQEHAPPLTAEQKRLARPILKKRRLRIGIERPETGSRSPRDRLRRQKTGMEGENAEKGKGMVWQSHRSRKSIQRHFGQARISRENR
jgi:hypothetical protein